MKHYLSYSNSNTDSMDGVAVWRLGCQNCYQYAANSTFSYNQIST